MLQCLRTLAKRAPAQLGELGNTTHNRKKTGSYMEMAFSISLFSPTCKSFNAAEMNMERARAISASWPKPLSVAWDREARDSAMEALIFL